MLMYCFNCENQYELYEGEDNCCPICSSPDIAEITSFDALSLDDVDFGEEGSFYVQ